MHSLTNSLGTTLMLTLALSACGGGANEAEDLSEPDNGTPSAVNNAPIASAGADLIVNTEAKVRLDGSGSTDPDDDPLTYRWQVTSLPDNSHGLLEDPNTVSPSFRADIDGNYIVTLTVSDGLLSSQDVLTIVAQSLVTNTAPFAHAGDDRSESVGTVITLDASDSYDAEGDEISYGWTLDSMPSSSNAELTGSNTINPSFAIDVAGDFSLSLTVTDTYGQSSRDTILITAISPSASRHYVITDTNQSLCYDSSTGNPLACSGTGADADHNGNKPSYTVSSDGLIVTDNVTGLVWQQSSDTNGDGNLGQDDKLYQSDAMGYCENLSYGGVDSWRLPSIKELYSLILFSGKDPSGYQGSDINELTPFIDEVFDWAFGDLDNGERIIDGQFASSTLYVSTTMNADATMFGVNFVDGRIKGYPSERSAYYVRCVSGGSDYGVNVFSDNGDQTVSDSETGLMWQQDDTDSTNWEDAIAQCTSAETGGYQDWRLPNVKELQSIVDYSRSPATHNQAAIDPVFNASPITNEAGEIDWGYYWASTSHVNHNDNGSSATYVAFGRALGFMNGTIMDVHGAGAQRSNHKLAVSSTQGASSSIGSQGSFYYHGPQGDILRDDNKVRCVRDSSVSEISDDDLGLVLFSPMASTETYLIDKQFNTVHTWQSEYRPGLSVYLLPSGELLRTGAMKNKPDVFSEQAGGSAGIIEIVDWDSNLLWQTTLASDSYLSHHDVEMLPNGNILALVWEAKTAEQAEELGRVQMTDENLWADAVYEICRANDEKTCIDGEIVWRWSVWDHLVQDVDPSISQNYVSDISSRKDKININFFSGAGGADWTHGNSIDYDSDSQQILISIRNFSEFWVINHDDSGQGIVHRAGNPSAYNGDGEQVLFVQHDARFIDSQIVGQGNILVFNNGANRPDGDYSSVDEFCYRGDSCNQGDLVRSYAEGAGGGFYANHISGAHRLDNGNTLVCEGTEGRLFEFNDQHEVVWEYGYGAEIFRATYYDRAYSGLMLAE